MIFAKGKGAKLRWILAKCRRRELVFSGFCAEMTAIPGFRGKGMVQGIEHALWVRCGLAAAEVCLIILFPAASRRQMVRNEK